jgi:hypothetical protein
MAAQGPPRHNDGHGFFQAGDAGATLTNVNDFRAIIDPEESG